ncbi:MAG: formate dehydrogenase accessory sulfurtransferase FdhD [Chloroflexota bacterium]|nr:formate dehydrogenase accessory sulfurtransferase FdhD [Chloroflexota bacterium]MDE2930913.1 formate dehydrogenase accessory sulfurtransferase FdhD [Chloroflexota bacterium]
MAQADIEKQAPTSPWQVTKISSEGVVNSPDVLAREEPLEIRLNGQSIAVTMRTPGQDEELAAGFLWTERLIEKPESLISIGHCPGKTEEERDNIVLAYVDGVSEALDVGWQRNFTATSSCGICGKASIAAVRQAAEPIQSDIRVAADVLHGLPKTLREAQETFDRTGALHAAGLFDREGELILLREDVGRHNAVDKVVGAALFRKMLPLENSLVLVSGRAGFEIVQKCLLAGVPIVAAVGAPSSLAVELAAESGMTLIGFLRDSSMNVYTGAERIKS